MRPFHRVCRFACFSVMLAACAAEGPDAASPTSSFAVSSGAGGSFSSTGTSTSTTSSGGGVVVSNPTDPALYLGGRLHAPASAPVIAHWKEIWKRNPSRNPKNFVRLGDNLSHSSHLLGCMG